MTKNELIDLLCINAYAVYTACLVGNPCKKVEDMMTFQLGHPIEEWSSKEKLHPGDLIMEISSLGMSQDNSNRIGYLISDQQEPSHSDEEWNNDAELRKGWDNERPHDRYVRIKRLSDGEEQRWENCNFIRVFTTMDEVWRTKSK